MTIITETWLNHNVAHAVIEVAGCSVYSWYTRGHGLQALLRGPGAANSEVQIPDGNLQ